MTLSPTPSEPSVLVIDDEHAVTKLYQRWLDDDYAVSTANSGTEALDRLDDSIDVVLLDRRMPGLHGDEVLDEIRNQGINCRVAMVTAIEPDFDIIDLGFDDYVTKPVTRQDLQETVEELLTLITYDELSRELYALCRKKGILEQEKSSAELAASEEYTELEEAIAATRHDLDAQLDAFDQRTFRAVFQDLSIPNQQGSPSPASGLGP